MTTFAAHSALQLLMVLTKDILDSRLLYFLKFFDKKLFSELLSIFGIGEDTLEDTYVLQLSSKLAPHPQPTLS
jgi:hypothetical protein